MRETTQFKLWRYLAPFRLKFFRKRFAEKKVRLLDVGCGIQRNAERDRTSATTSCPRSFHWLRATTATQISTERRFR
jgi:hypothetical protein